MKKQAGSGSVLGQLIDYFGAEEIVLPSCGALIVFCPEKMAANIVVITGPGNMDFASVIRCRPEVKLIDDVIKPSHNCCEPVINAD